MAEENDESSKTEDASARKLDEARDKGQVVQSREVTNWLMMMSIGAICLMLGPMTASSISRTLQKFIEQPHAIRIDDTLTQAVVSTITDVTIATAPILLLLLATAIVGPVMQTGFIFAWDKLQPKLENISPLSGAKRLFSLRALIEFGKGIAKILIVGAVAFYLVWPELHRLSVLPTLEVPAIVAEVSTLVIRMLSGVIAVVAVIAILDYLYQRFDFLKSMRMSRHEVKEEYRQVEGDPMIKSKLRQLRNERARRRMMSSVPSASVVITNPTHFAVALKYETGAQGAPRVVAKGADLVAAKIREIAAANDVPIVENPPVARALFATVEIDQEIPPEHYRAVAEIISYVFRLKGRAKTLSNR